MHDKRGLFEQLPDRCKLLFDALIVLGQEFPDFGEDRKILKTSDL